MNVTNGQEVKNAANGNNNGVVFKPEPLTRNLSTADTTVSTLAWVNWQKYEENFVLWNLIQSENKNDNIFS